MRLFRSTKSIGDLGERAAVRLLKKDGWKIRARNYVTAHGEIDIIAENAEYIIFVEVKTRQIRADGRYGRPADAVDRRKRDRLRYSMVCYLRAHPSYKKQRMDIIEVYKTEQNGRFKVEDLRHIPCAFGANE